MSYQPNGFNIANLFPQFQANGQRFEVSAELARVVFEESLLYANHLLKQDNSQLLSASDLLNHVTGVGLLSQDFTIGQYVELMQAQGIEFIANPAAADPTRAILVNLSPTEV